MPKIIDEMHNKSIKYIVTSCASTVLVDLIKKILHLCLLQFESFLMN
jgi:hypothetical protein